LTMQLLAVGPSPMLIRVQKLAAGVTLATGLWLAASGQWLAAGAVALAALWAWQVRQHGCRLGLRDDGVCEIDAGTEAVVASAFCGAGWVVLRLAGAGRVWPASRVLVLAPDAASAEELRQLRVWLKWAVPRGN